MLSMDEGIKSRFKNYAKDIKKTHGNVKEIYINDKLSRLGIKEILTQIKKTDLIIISMLVRIRMDKGISTIDDTHNLLISKIKKIKIPILGISFGSPYLPDYSNLDAYICTYGYGSISLNAASNAILGRIDINGKLPVSLNEKFRIGYGIKVKKEYSQFESELDIDLNGAIKIIHTAINDSIFPGAQIFISQGKNIILNEDCPRTIIGSQNQYDASFDYCLETLDQFTRYNYTDTKLIFSGKLLKDGEIIKDIGLKEGFTIIAVDSNFKQVKNKEIANLLNVQYQTTLLIFKDNKEVYRSIGETTKDLIYEAIKSSI